MLADTFIEALGRTLGIPLALSDKGSVALSMGGRSLLIQWVEAAQSFMFYAEVAPVPEWCSAAVCRLLLSSNFMLMETQGATLSWSAETGMAGLNLPLPAAGLDKVSFIRAVDAIVRLSDEWRNRIEAICEDEERRVDADQKRLLSEGMIRASVPDLPMPAMIAV